MAAKIIVEPGSFTINDEDGDGNFHIYIQSSLGKRCLDTVWGRDDAQHCANKWARQLGDIPVKMKK